MFFEDNEGEMEQRSLRVRLLKWREVPSADDNDYPAVVLKDGDQFLYRARGFTVPITEDEARMVVANPYMYYFSTALQLHNRINRQVERQGDDESIEST